MQQVVRCAGFNSGVPSSLQVPGDCEAHLWRIARTRRSHLYGPRSTNDPCFMCGTLQYTYMFSFSLASINILIPFTCKRWWSAAVGVPPRAPRPQPQHHQDALRRFRLSECRSELTQTSQDEKNFKSKCYSSGSSKDTLCGDPEGHTRL